MGKYTGVQFWKSIVLQVVEKETIEKYSNEVYYISLHTQHTRVMYTTL